LKRCPICDVELDEVFYAPEPDRDRLLPPGELKYACPDCERQWRRSDTGPLVPFTATP